MKVTLNSSLPTAVPQEQFLRAVTHMGAKEALNMVEAWEGGGERTEKNRPCYSLMAVH